MCIVIIIFRVCALVSGIPQTHIPHNVLYFKKNKNRKKNVLGPLIKHPDISEALAKTRFENNFICGVVSHTHDADSNVITQNICVWQIVY